MGETFALLSAAAVAAVAAVAANAHAVAVASASACIRLHRLNCCIATAAARPACALLWAKFALRAPLCRRRRRLC